MKWFRKRKKKHNNRKIHVALDRNNIIPLTTLARWYLYDTDLEEPNKVAPKLGMSLVSEEGHEKEMQDSDKRIDKIFSLYPFIGAIADINARAVAATQVMHMEDYNGGTELSDSEAIISELYRVIGHAAITSAFSTAVELGIVQLSEGKDVSKIVEEYDEF
jgi:hypothetical protein